MNSSVSAIVQTGRNWRSARCIAVAIIALGAGAAVFGIANRSMWFGVPMISVGVAAFLTVVLLKLVAVQRDHLLMRTLEVLKDVVELDGNAVLVSDSNSFVLSSNAVATSSLMAQSGGPATVAGCLKGVFADPVGIVHRLENRSRLAKIATEEVISHMGRARLIAYALNSDRIIWRLETDFLIQPPKDQKMPIPLLTVGRNNTILSMNDACLKLVGHRQKTLDRLFQDMPLRHGDTHFINTDSGLTERMVTVTDTGVGRQEILLLPPLLEGEGKEIGDFGFESFPVPLLRLDRSGQILDSNSQARRLLQSDATGGTCLSDFMEGLGRSIPEWLADATKHPQVTQSEFLRLSDPDLDVFLQVTLSRAVDGSNSSLIAVLNDATELKSLEAQFVQSQKMQAIGQLAGGVAHDFNNLLTAISGHCDLLLLRHDQGDPEYGDLIQIHQNANRAASLVGQLLAFSRKQTLQSELIDLRVALSDLTHLLNRLVGEKVTLTLNHRPVLPPIRADRRQLEQVMMNLVVNARDAMPDGGAIQIETDVLTVTEEWRKERTVVPPGEYVRVIVRDEGAGIPPHQLSKVFEPFFTTKRPGEGTGLGLSTVYGIVKQTGGFIFVESTLNKGTEFQLILPAQDNIPDQIPTAVAVEKTVLVSKPGGVVLLVEDEAPVRAFASRAMRLRGYTVIEADSAESAMDLLADQNLEVDVIVTDVVMPGMDGPTWVRKARIDRPDTRVIFVSGYAEDAFDDVHDPVPNSVFLPKPFSLKELTDTVGAQLNAEVYR